MTLPKTNRYKYYIQYLLSEALGKGISFLLLPLLTRVFTPDDYGELTQFTAVYNLCLMLCLCSGQAYLRKVYFNEVPLGKVFLSSVFLNFIALIFVFLFILVIEDYYAVSAFSNKLVLVISAVSIISLILFRYLAIIYNVKFKSNNYLLVNSAFNITSLLITLVLIAYLNFHINERVFAIIISPLMILPFVVYLIKKEVKIEKKISIKSIVEHLHFGAPLFIHQLLAWVRVSLDKLLVASYFGVSVLGEYAANVQLSMVLFIVYTALNQAIAPKIIHQLKNSNGGEQEWKYIHHKYVLIFIGISFVFSPLIILFGDKVLGENYSVDILLVTGFLLAYTFNGLYFIYTHSVIQSNKSRMIANVSLWSAVIYLTSLSISILFMDVYSFVISSLISSVAAFVLIYKSSRRVCCESSF